jgi:hypothetical protein
MTELYGHYHGRLLALARTAADDGAWRAQLREILADFDKDCRLLPPLGRYVARDALASQIEREALQFSDPDKRAVLILALKHFDAGEARCRHPTSLCRTSMRKRCQHPCWAN